MEGGLQTGRGWTGRNFDHGELQIYNTMRPIKTGWGLIQEWISSGLTN